MAQACGVWESHIAELTKVRRRSKISNEVVLPITITALHQLLIVCLSPLFALDALGSPIVASGEVCATNGTTTLGARHFHMHSCGRCFDDSLH